MTRSSHVRFQADFTHYRLARYDGLPGPDVEVLSWLDDCSRCALGVTAHLRVAAFAADALRRHVHRHHAAVSTGVRRGGVVAIVCDGP